MTRASASPDQIVRCLKHDMGGDLKACIRYASAIAVTSRMSPYASFDMADNYAEAARRLREEETDRALQQELAREMDVSLEELGQLS